MEIDVKDLYQFLITDCRYGYSRNNHLMPSCAYTHVKEYIPKMHQIDEKWAIHTAQQLCEEAISMELISNFYDGEDDEYGNRKETIKFINWCLEFIESKNVTWKPYNYKQYLENLKKDNEPRYQIYDMIDGMNILLTPTPISQNEYLDLMWNYINSDSGVFRKETIKMSEDNYADRRRHYIYHVTEPIKKDFYVKHI